MRLLDFCFPQEGNFPIWGQAIHILTQFEPIEPAMLQAVQQGIFKLLSQHSVRDAPRGGTWLRRLHWWRKEGKYRRQKSLATDGIRAHNHQITRHVLYHCATTAALGQAIQLGIAPRSWNLKPNWFVCGSAQEIKKCRQGRPLSSAKHRRFKGDPALRRHGNFCIDNSSTIVRQYCWEFQQLRGWLSPSRKCWN